MELARPVLLHRACTYGAHLWEDDAPDRTWIWLVDRVQVKAPGRPDNDDLPPLS